MGQTRLGELLEGYQKVHEKRALGGMRALSGFHYQLWVYLADLCEALAREHLDVANTLTPEALSDVLKQEDDRLVCVQVKRTLRSDSLRDAVREFLVIDEFLRDRDSRLGARAQYQIHCAHCQINTADLRRPLTFPDHPAREAEWNARLQTLRDEGRLLPIVVERDPQWRAVVAAFSRLERPFDFLRAAVDAVLRLLADFRPEDARNEVIRLWSELRRDLTMLKALAPQDFDPTESTTRVLVGERPSLAYLREGAFMARPRLLQMVRVDLRRVTDTPSPTDDNRIPLFWITGASGSGKSILLLKLMQALVCEDQAPVVWLDDMSDQLLPVLEEWVGRQPVVAPPHDWLVFVDDFFAPGQQSRADLPALSRLVRNCPLRYPVVITCGPPEQLEELRSEGAGAFAITKWDVPLADRTEKDSFRAWYHDRTGKRAHPRGAAFAHASGLPISMVFEMAEGDLTQFAKRFRDRLTDEQLVEALRPLLTLNRLYVWPPWQWLDDDEHARLRRLNEQQDFYLDTDERAGYLRLTHPHLADAVYQALYHQPDDITRAVDIGRAFARAAAKSHPVTLAILRLLCRGHERLTTVHHETLLSRLTPVWELLAQATLDQASQAELAVYAAVLSARSTALRDAAPAGYDPLRAARQALGQSHPVWGWLWRLLHAAYPQDKGLEDDALAWLEPGLTQYDPQWSPVWEALVEADCEDPRLPDLGRQWLEQHAWQPDWNYVFRAMSQRWLDQMPLSLALQLLDTHPDNRNTAYVLQTLLGLTDPSDARRVHLLERADWAFVWRKLGDLPDLCEARRAQLLEQGSQWLHGREERDEWTFVWQKLVDLSDVPAKRQAELIEQGWQWLHGREERDEWTFVWRELVDLSDATAERRRDLMERGWQWLQGREERSGWVFVWRKLVDLHDLQAQRRRELMERGWQWLQGREERSEWNFVWQKLVDLPDLQAQRQRGLMEQGWEWLQGREERDGWTFVWRKLVEVPQLEAQRRRELIERGWQWLQGREERDGWTFVWQKLLDLPDLPPERRQELIKRGSRWLSMSGHRRRKDWSFVWQLLCPRGVPSVLQTKALLALCREWLLGEGMGTPEWDHLYEQCLEGGVSDQEFLDTGVGWVGQHLEERHALRILEKLLRRFPRLTTESAAVAVTLEWLHSHWDHLSWGFLWCALFEQGLRVGVEELGFEFCQRYPTDARTSFVAQTLAGSGETAISRQTAAMVAVLTEAPYASSCLVCAYRSTAGDPAVAASCRQWLLAHSRERKPKGWAIVFCLLRPDHHTKETIESAVGVIERFPLQGHAGLLTALAHLDDQLAPEQRDSLLASIRQSLANPDRPPSEEWHEVGRLLWRHNNVGRAP